MQDAIVISDLHLGSDNCRAKELVFFLHSIHREERKTKRLILNGDVFDSIDFRRLKKSHWKVLSLIRKLSDDLEIIWINGNHDGSAEIISHLLGVTVQDEYQFDSGGKRILLLHGHQFDQFISHYPITTWFADRVYRVLQRIDGSHRFAKMAKRRSKVFLRCLEKIETGALEYARRMGCDIVCCGHTHVALEKSAGLRTYYNSGCWTEFPSHYLSVHDGIVSVAVFDEFENELREAKHIADMIFEAD